VSGFPDNSRLLAGFLPELSLPSTEKPLQSNRHSWGVRLGVEDMDIARFRLAQGVVVEEVGNDLMVMVPGSTEIVSLSGAAAEIVRRAHSGD
jgi:hypothetical protein